MPNQLALRDIRIRKGYSQEYVASYLNITQPAYSKLESGKTGITLNLVEKLAVLYNMSNVDFLNSILVDQRIVGTNFTHKDLIIKSLMAEIRRLRRIVNSLNSAT